MRLFLGLVALMSVSGCAATPDLPPVKPYAPAALSATRYKAVLIAGDSRIAVFDNAVDGVAARLRDRAHIPTGDIQRLSAVPAVIAQDGVRSASRDHVLAAIERMAPSAGEGCFVFATSHGIKGAGLVLSPVPGQVLTPEALDAALVRGCGNAPTAVVISSCFSGNFAAGPMARDNRVVLTAARADRPSFGCGADETYTVYDRCLLDAFDAGGTWVAAQASIRACVTGEERRRRVPASDPQAWFGSAVADMQLPGG